MRYLILILTVLLNLNVYSQCVSGTPPTLTCGTTISVADGTASGAFGTVSTNTPTCASGADKFTHSDIYKITYAKGQVIDVDCEAVYGFIEVLSSDGCTSYGCEKLTISGLTIDGSSYVQDASSLNTLIRFTMGLDDIGLTEGVDYLIKYASIANCGGSACTSATVGTDRAYDISCNITLPNSCENGVVMSGGTTYSITNEYTSDNSADVDGAGIDCGASIESNLMYRWCTDASNTEVTMQLTNVVINDGSTLTIGVLDDNCGADFTDIQCESGISTAQNITISNVNTVASTCYWISFDGNAGTNFNMDVKLVNAVTLPIELISFAATKNIDDVFLSWVTASEINNDKFEIYWSDNALDWELIHTRDGAGNSSTTKSYYHTHSNPEVNNYYKLKQVDYDGKSSQSRLIYINMGEDTNDYYYINVMGQEVNEFSRGQKKRVIIHK